MDVYLKGCRPRQSRRYDSHAAMRQSRIRGAGTLKALKTLKMTMD